WRKSAILTATICTCDTTSQPFSNRGHQPTRVWVDAVLLGQDLDCITEMHRHEHSRILVLNIDAVQKNNAPIAGCCLGDLKSSHADSMCLRCREVRELLPGLIRHVRLVV